jgi:hypothetical protein
MEFCLNPVCVRFASRLGSGGWRGHFQMGNCDFCHLYLNLRAGMEEQIYHFVRNASIRCGS